MVSQPTPFQYEWNYLTQFFETVGLMYVMLDMLCMVLSFFLEGKELSKVCFCASSVQTWHLTWRTFDSRYSCKHHLQTAISRKFVGKSAGDNPERYCGWFWVHCSSKKFERMSREAMDVCLRVFLYYVVHIYDFDIFIISSSSFHGFITNQFNDLLPDGLLA